MNRRLVTFTLLLAGFLPLLGQAAELKLYPTDIPLTGPKARQRLLLVQDEAGTAVAELTAGASFTSSNPAVATVEEGVVRPVGDGETVITATQQGHTASATVRVSRFKETLERSFRNHVIPMLTKAGCNSGACHGALAGKGGMKLSLRGYDPAADHFVLTRQVRGRRVDRLDPVRSLMLQKATAALEHGGGQKLDPSGSDYTLLADWIAGGAGGPNPADPALQRLEIMPAVARLKPKDTLRVLVRGWYADGHAEEVTSWGKYSSSEDLVAGVDDTGFVKVAGHGEAAISVWYSNVVASARVAAPLPTPVEPAAFAVLPRVNFIDELVLRKLEALRIPPSPTCSDAAFLRRAMLDAAGILPTPEELQAFLVDQSPDKRAKVIDALLERPEFVDYWAYKWSDLLLISTRKLPQPAVWAFYQHVRQGVADNKPWDRFAREIVTASGGTLQNGAANYFVVHKDVTDLTEATAVTFLGMSITCCRCHNHPLEKWTQDQYWGMANLFARVALKNGDRTGDVTVQAQPSGDAPHPRRGTPIAPTPLDAPPLALDSLMDRRHYFADWLTAPENPYFAKAVVNRVWRNFLGRGLVEAEDDLRQTNPPTNGELFDALARDFISHKFDLKHLMRTIMNSATYQRSAQTLPANQADDRFYSHYLVRRLSAEVILDAYAQVTAVPTPFDQIVTGVEGGKAAFGGAPLGTRAMQLPDSQIASRFLDAFGRPDRTQTCSCERQSDSTVTQALHLTNGQTLNEKLRATNSRLDQWLTDKISDEAAVTRLYALALSREPTAAELGKFTRLLADAKTTDGQGRREVFEDLFWAVLTGREFLFNH